ncbi:Pex3p [Saccharomyces cerevisiae VL3]|uniref:Pex3p n=2 Tax=Saccharomyces TaxID=4930 RepID=H0GEF8_SACCK|nr:hypothetical protein AWRI1631_45460 [Saccharomyces cerevisiae AWRI1631]EGA87457.1 Pex3p [Saccharomyces cerevisiae VL3]EHN07898.1 Pex3p [Saccharomyces cerevisiae x Saccharomyces kudriavzevii VIN7]
MVNFIAESRYSFLVRIFSCSLVKRISDDTVYVTVTSLIKLFSSNSFHNSALLFNGELSLLSLDFALVNWFFWSFNWVTMLSKFKSFSFKTILHTGSSSYIVYNESSCVCSNLLLICSLMKCCSVIRNCCLYNHLFTKNTTTDPVVNKAAIPVNEMSSFPRCLCRSERDL